MPSIGERLEADWDRAAHAATHPADWFGHHSASAEPSAAAVTIGTTTPRETPMSGLLTEIKNDAKSLAAKFEGIDEAVLARLEAIQGSPGIMTLVDAALAAVHVPPNAYAIAINSLEELEKLYDPARQQAAAEPRAASAEAQYATAAAGPVVGGQA